MTNEVVPGMGEAVEKRRKELGLTLEQFAAAANLTREGLRHVRSGHRRHYQDRTRYGVAKALHWPRDWIERLYRGEPVPPAVEPERTIESPDVLTAIASDPALNDEAKQLLTAYYFGLVLRPPE